MRAVGLQLVIFDEINAGLRERAYKVCSFLGRETDAWFDDRADDRPFVDAAELPGASHSELRTGIAIQESRRERNIEKLQTGKWLQLEEITGYRAHHVRK